MGGFTELFARRDDPEPTTTVVRHGPTVAASNGGSSTLAEFTVPAQLYSRSLAQSVPTVNRGTDLLKGTISALPPRHWMRQPVGTDDTEQEPLSWFDRPDPRHTRPWLIAWTVDDLIHYGRAYWLIASRFTTGLAATFRRIPYDEAAVRNSSLDRDEIVDLTWRGRTYAAADILVFEGLVDGLLEVGWRAISTAIRLDEAADRFAGNEVPSGWLQEQDVGGNMEDLSLPDLQEMANYWHSNRRANVTAALTRRWHWEEATYDPERLQLIESRQHQALELSRLVNVPPWTTGAPQGASMTYANATQARLDLIDFGSLPYVVCIEQTLSGPQVLPRGRYLTLDTDAWLRNPLLATPGVSVGDNQAVPVPGDTPKDQTPDTQEVP